MNAPARRYDFVTPYGALRPQTAPSPARPPARPAIQVHWTPFAPGILAEAAIAHPSRWAAYYSASDVQALRTIAERLDRAPARLGFRLSAICEVEIFETTRPADILAIITEGMSCAAAEAAREAIVRGAIR